MPRNQIQEVYKRFFIEDITTAEQGIYVFKSRIPRSITCPDLKHYSPTDFTLTLMQAGATAALNELTGNYADILFLSHRARYFDQNQSNLTLTCKLKRSHAGQLSALNLELNADNIVCANLMGGVIKNAQHFHESHEAKGIKISSDQITEVLSLYTGEKQSDIREVAYDKDTGVFESTVEFPPYIETDVISHVSARQMIEAMMKAALCGAAHLASIKKINSNYEHLLSQRLNIKTQDQDIKYRKLLSFGTRSLLRFQLLQEYNKTTVFFSHRPKSTKSEESFATGRMTFYLPN